MRERTTKFNRDGFSKMRKSELVSRLITMEHILDLYKNADTNPQLPTYKKALKNCVKAYAMAQGKPFTQTDLDRMEQVFIEEAEKNL